MDHFNYQNNQLFAEEVAVADIVAQFGTPCYIYSRATIERHWHVINDALGSHPHTICYAVKANSNIAILNLLARLGSGFDIVSRGELARVVAAQGDTSKTLFSGVGKTEQEIEEALSHNIFCINAESSSEIEKINTIAGRMNKTAPIALRINPDVDAKTHPHISTGLKENKFGIPIEEAFALFQHAKTLPHLSLVGVDCHIGSQITELSPFMEALDQLLALIDQLNAAKITIKHINLGGGLGVPYKDETPPTPKEYTQALVKKIAPRKLHLILEPGRVIMANAGILATTVETIKRTSGKDFAIVDAGMNDLLRPALYSAWQNVVPVNSSSQAPSSTYDVVGPICETADFLAKNRELAISEGDLLAIRSAGAYGFCMSSQYNSRPRVAELLVDKNQVHLIRTRETINDLFASETLLS